MSKRSWRKLFTSRRATWQSLTTNLNQTALEQHPAVVGEGTDKSTATPNSENRGPWKVR
jgi:hypothetical protein